MVVMALCFFFFLFPSFIFEDMYRESSSVLDEFLILNSKTQIRDSDSTDLWFKIGLHHTYLHENKENQSPWFW